VASRATVLGENESPAFVGPPFSIVGAGDFNQDSNADILWHNSSTGEIQIWFMNGFKVASRATVLGEDGSPTFIGPPFSIVGVGDFNKDGNADILWHNSSTGEIQIWFMNGFKVASRATVLGEDGSPTFIGPPFSIVGAGDFNQDGNADILWHNSSTGEIQIWFMNTSKVAGRATVLGENSSPSFIGPPWSIASAGTFRPALNAVCEFLDPPGSPTVGIRAYGLKGGEPRKSQLTWSLTDPVTLVPPRKEDAGVVIGMAFRKWSNVAPALTFNALTTGDPGDIHLHGADLGPSGALGKTQWDGSDIQFNKNAAVIFSAQQPDPAPTLLAVATHEIGHALGLMHSTNPASVMFPFNSSTETLDPEDVAAIRALYGWAPQTLISGIGTDASPALCACGGTLVMAWKGIGDDHRIWMANSTDGQGKKWTPQSVVPGAASADGPALAWDGAVLWLALRGVPGDDGLYWATSSNLGNTWSSVAKIPGTGSSNSPSIAIFNGAPILVWKGLAGDSGLYFTLWQSPGNPWLPQFNIGGMGSADRPAICIDFAGLPRMVWRGIEDDHVLYTSTLVSEPGVQFWQPQQILEWIVVGNGPQGTVGIGTPGSSAGPGITSSAGKVFLVWQGVPGDDGIYFTQAAAGPGGVPPVEWSSQAKVPGVGTSGRPAIAAFGGRVFLAWKGVHDDHNIFTTFV
jgi:hypothetical protein